MDNYNDRDKIRKKLLKYSTTTISDALDSMGIKDNVIIGIHPVWKCGPIVGFARTMRSIPIGTKKQEIHGSIVMASKCHPGDIIVIGNNGDIENNSWGEIVSCVAQKNGAVGCVSDGAVRDIEEIEQLGFPVYAKGVTPRTGRGRMVLDSVDVSIRFGNTQVCPGDIVFADANGIVIIPVDILDDVIKKAKIIYESEKKLIEEIKNGSATMSISYDAGYESMLFVNT